MPVIQRITGYYAQIVRPTVSYSTSLPVVLSVHFPSKVGEINHHTIADFVGRWFSVYLPVVFLACHGMSAYVLHVAEVTAVVVYLTLAPDRRGQSIPFESISLQRQRSFDCFTPQLDRDPLYVEYCSEGDRKWPSGCRF